MNHMPVTRAKLGFAGLAATLAATLALVAFPAVAPAAGPGGWDHLGTGLNDRVFALNTDQPGTLLVGGVFTDAGGNTDADYIAGWNGTTWGSLGPSGSLNGAVHAIAFANGNVYAGGNFTNAGGSGANYLAVWNGAAWQSFCAPLSAQVLSLEVVGSTLYVGGSFLNVNGDPAADQLIKCDLAGGYIGPTVDSDADLDGGVQALVADGAGNLYAGGTFINMDGKPQADYVARYDGASWSAMGSGLDPNAGAIDSANVDSLASDGTNVYVGADDTDIAGIPAADHIARWDGGSWSAVGSGPGGDGWLPATAAVNGLVSDGTRLFATGEWADAGGDPLADDVAIFDGTAWTHLGSSSDLANGPWLGTGNAIARFNGATVVGGGFVDAGGDTAADRITAYPDVAPPPPDLTGPVAALGKTPKKKVFTDEQKAKVKFTFAAPDAVSYLCRLDNKEFAPCASPKKVKAKVGKHTFQVEGVDAAGNVGAPDKFKFKVVREN